MYKIVPAERQGRPKEMIIKTAVNHRKTAYNGHFGTPGETRTHYIPLRSSPQFANRFVTKHKETQAFTGFWRVLFLTIPKGFTAKITSFFGL